MNTKNTFPTIFRFCRLPTPAKLIGPGFGLFAAIVVFSVSEIQAATLKPEKTAASPLVQAFSQLPLSFEANLGQTDSAVNFLSRGQGYSLFLTPTEAVLALHKTEPRNKPADHKPLLGKPAPAKPVQTSVLRMRLQGADPKASVSGLDELPGKTNYFRGKDPKAWRTGIPSFAKVKYSAVYPGIDLVYYGKQRQLEYDFVVAPGADPKAIRLDFEGAEKLSLDADGRLIVKTAGGEVIQHKPAIYQDIGGVRKTIGGGYALYPDPAGKTSRIGFQVAQYDASKPLIIDPVLGYSTYLGGSGSDIGNDIVVDKKGNAYVTGITSSSDFPSVNAEPLNNPSDTNNDAFVTKFNTKGAVIYSSVLGGDSNDQAYGIAVDAHGDAYIAGYSTSGFPVLHPIQEPCNGSAFVTKLGTSGTLVYSTCLGQDASANAIAVDRFGNAYVTGTFWLDKSHGDFFPLVNAVQSVFGGGIADAFVAKINPKGSALVYSTYLGGGFSPYQHTFQNYDKGNAIAVDRFGNAYITGVTSSEDFPTARAFQSTFIYGYSASGEFADTFVTKLSASGNALIFSTFVGPAYFTQGGVAIAVDPFGNAYVTGDLDFSESSIDIPIVCPTNACYGPLAAKFRPGGEPLFSIGSSYNEAYSRDIALDRYGNIYLTGGWRNLPEDCDENPDQPNCVNRNFDAFAMKFLPNGNLAYFSSLGGSGIETDYGYGITADRLGNAYVTGSTESSDFPTVSAFQSNLGGSDDAFIAKIVGK